MCEGQVAQVPGGLLRHTGRHNADAEERQLEPIAPSARRLKVPGVVPPLRAVLVVGAVVARELELVAGECRKEVRSRMQNAECRIENEEKDCGKYCFLHSEFCILHSAFI